jgi:hypothetical protein
MIMEAGLIVQAGSKSVKKHNRPGEFGQKILAFY